jgi:hypothetical protein
MRTIHRVTTAIAAALLVGGLAVPVLGGDVVRGRDLLTTEEWQAHRTEMLNATTPAERQAVRQKMQDRIGQRAAEQGVTLRHQQGGPMRGFGPGFGPGYGFGAGPRG